MFEQSGLFDTYASYHRCSDRIVWDNDTGKVYVGVQNKELATAWQEYLMCDCILPPLEIAPAEITCVVANAKCRYELVGNCTQEEAEAVAVKRFDFTKSPPLCDRSLSTFSRGSIVRILFTSSGAWDKRIGKTGVVVAVDEYCKRLEVELEDFLHRIQVQPAWIVKIGQQILPPSVRWEMQDKIIWIEHHLFADGKKSRFHVGKPQVKSYGRQIGIPDGMEFALFENGQMVNFFVQLSEAKSRAEELCCE